MPKSIKNFNLKIRPQMYTDKVTDVKYIEYMDKLLNSV